MSKVARPAALRPFTLATLLLSPAALSAQVGHDPASSPYHPLLRRMSVVALGSYIGGSSGVVGVGPAGGYGAGVRYELELTGPTDAFVSLGWSNLNRMVADPAQPADAPARSVGPLRQGVLFAEGGLLILLAGDKTWRGLAPYFGGTLGLAWGASSAQDSSGYKFKTKFVTGPLIGLRFYFSQSVSLRAEGRLQFWKLSYPTSYFLAPVNYPNDAPILDQSQISSTEWTSHPALLIGLGYAFRF